MSLRRFSGVCLALGLMAWISPQFARAAEYTVSAFIQTLGPRLPFSSNSQPWVSTIKL